PLIELFARDRQRRADHADVPGRPQKETLFERPLRPRSPGFRHIARTVERHQRLARLAVLHELESPETAEPAHLADRGVLLLEACELSAEDLAHGGRVFDDALFLEGLD